MRSALANLRAYPARFVAVLLSIAIGVGFTVSTLVFTASFRTDLTASIGAAASKVDVIAYPVDLLAADDPRLTATAEMAAAEPIYRSTVAFSTPTARGWLGVETVPTNESLRWFGLTAGTWPSGLGQVVTDRGTATRNGLDIGSALTVADRDGTSRTVTVVGLVDLQRSTLAGAFDEVLAAPELASALAGRQPSELDLTAAAGVSPESLAASVAAALGATAEVRTGQQVVDKQVATVLGESNVLAQVLLTFAAIAGVVASFVIANTFTILLTQRQRQIGLLRCVGASRRQVRRSVLAEALLIGSIGSVAGAFLGLGAGRAAMAVAKVSGSSFTVDPVSMVLSLVAGVSVTVLAALFPAARAMRVTPLAALNPVPNEVEARRTGRVRLVVGSVLTLVGVVGLIGGVVLPALIVSVAGGAVSAVGVLLLLRSALPVVLHGIGRLARVGGVPGRLAAGNAERNPGRAATTSSALVIAVGLIITLQVAGASARASLNQSLAEHFPLDVSITASDGVSALPAGLADQITGVAGLHAMAMAGTGATIELAGTPTPLTVLGAPAEVSSVIRSGALSDGTVAVPDWMLDGYGLAVGDRLQLTAASGSITMTVAASRLADGQGLIAVVSASDLARLDPAAAPVAIWGQLADIDRANEVISTLKPLLAPYAGLALGGAAADHASIEEGLSTMLLIVTVLLGVAAVIAVVGIGNTLALSVVERTRESALLRALGLRRGQLRLMLAVEAALLAAVGSVVGIGLGVGYGWVGAAATFRQAGEPVALALPGGQLLMVLGLALLAGVAASVLPARRAAMAAPTDALAES